MAACCQSGVLLPMLFWLLREVRGATSFSKKDRASAIRFALVGVKFGVFSFWQLYANKETAKKQVKINPRLNFLRGG
jgi:hypothetical protein